MTAAMDGRLAAAGIDAVALKPSEMDLSRAQDLPVSTLTVDYEGREHVPAPGVFADLAGSFDCRATVPVRADGFDPLGDAHLRSELPGDAGEVLVAGHGAYLSEEERRRAVAPRLREAAAGATEPWVGTEGVERLALAVGGTQFELLSATTSRDVRSLRAAGFEGDIAVYAPTVLSDDDDEILDGVGDYAARRGPVRRRLPEDAPTDSTATGETRELLSKACRDFALVGSPETVESQVSELQSVGVNRVVAYPARGLSAL
jgi:hypothetical protein